MKYFPPGHNQDLDERKKKLLTLGDKKDEGRKKDETGRTVLVI